MQRLLVQFVLTSARWTNCNDGLRPAATQVVDKLPYTTEPGLQAYSFYFFIKEETVLSKKKVAGILGGIAFLVIAVLAFLYFFVLKNASSETDFEKLREGMKAAELINVPGISMYVPEDYEKTESEYFTAYTKGGAKVMLGSDEVSNDLENYAYYAVRKYEDITDVFNIKEEYTENVSGSDVHVVIFDYSLSLEDGVKSFSCLSAFKMGEGRAYVLTCTADSSDFALYFEDFCRIYKTMAVTGNSEQ